MKNITDTSIEKKKWYKNAMAIFALVGALTVTITQIYDVPFLKPKALKSLPTYEILLDTSKAMNPWCQVSIIQVMSEIYPWDLNFKRIADKK